LEITEASQQDQQQQGESAADQKKQTLYQEKRGPPFWVR
jgi:hypothetical protein